MAITIKEAMENYRSMDPERVQTGKKQVLQIMDRYIWANIHEMYQSYPALHTEMYQEAVVAILKELPRYEESSGSMTTFLKPYIRAAIRDFAVSEISGLTKHYNGKVLKIKKAIARLQKEGHSEITEEDIDMVTNLGIPSIRQCLEMIKMGEHVCFSPDGDPGPINEGNTMTPEREFLEKEFIQELEITFLSMFGEERKDMIADAYGLFGHPKKEMDEIAFCYNMKESTVRESIRKSFETIKKQYHNNINSFLNRGEGEMIRRRRKEYLIKS